MSFRFVFLVGAVLSLPVSTIAQDRATLVDQYMTKVAPVQALGQFKRTVTEATESALRQPTLQALDFMYPQPAVTAAVREAAATTYDDDELRALLDFYATAVGARVLAKHGQFLARLHLRLSSDASKRLEATPATGNPFERK